MTKDEQTAFVNSYATRVANAPKEYVAQFVERFCNADDDDLYDKNPVWYTSIMDALLVWIDATRYTQGETK